LPRHDTAKATVSDLATITSTSERGDSVSVYKVRVQRGIYKTDSTLKSVFADSGFVEWDGRASSPIVVKTWADSVRLTYVLGDAKADIRTSSGTIVDKKQSIPTSR